MQRAPRFGQGDALDVERWHQNLAVVGLDGRQRCSSVIYSERSLKAFMRYSQVNEDLALPWFGPNVFGDNLGLIDSITMIQSEWTVGPKIGLLELIPRIGGNLFFFREDAPPYRWWGPLAANNFNQASRLA